MSDRNDLAVERLVDFNALPKHLSQFGPILPNNFAVVENNCVYADSDTDDISKLALMLPEER
jgi:hypothetical protein